MAVSPLTVTTALSSWTFTSASLLPFGLGAAALFRRQLAVAVGCLGWLVITACFLGVYDHDVFWVLAVQDVLLLTLVPIPFVLGLDVSWRVPPLAGSVLAVAVLTLVYVTGWDQARLEHPALLAVTQLLLVALGCLFLGPLLDDHRGGYAGRALIAFLDGLIDAVPGLVVLGTHGLIAGSWYRAHPRPWGPSPLTDQHLGGTAMIALSELVGLPALLLLVVRWVRSDAREAVLVDAHLDSSPADDTTEIPWWERDPGPLAGRWKQD